MHIPDSLVSFCNSVGRIPAMHLISRSYFISHGLTKVRNRGGGRNTYPWRGNENFDQCGSYSSLSDPDIFGTSAPNYPSFQHHQREANRCVEIELHPPTAGIVRSSVGVSPAVSISGPDRRCPGTSQFLADMEGGRQSGINRMCHLDTVIEEDSF